jgi:hypothetical protein
MGWKFELGAAIVFILLTMLWVARAEAGYEGTYHPERSAEQIVKREGMVIWRIFDGPVRCYIVLTEPRMIGVQSSVSCVIPESPRDAEETPEEEK